MKTPVFSFGAARRAAGRLRCALVGALAFATPSVPAEPLSGGTFVLVGAPAGGGSSSGGGFSLTGWIASSGAGTSSGEAFDLTCGLLGTYVVPDEVTLQVEVTDDGNVRIWWPATVQGYQLEFTPALGPGAVWQAVTPAPVENSYAAPADQATRFFRLRKL